MEFVRLELWWDYNLYCASCYIFGLYQPKLSLAVCIFIFPVKHRECCMFYYHVSLKFVICFIFVPYHIRYLNVCWFVYIQYLKYSHLFHFGIVQMIETVMKKQEHAGNRFYKMTQPIGLKIKSGILISFFLKKSLLWKFVMHDHI